MSVSKLVKDVVLWEDIVAADGYWAVFNGKQIVNIYSWGVIWYNFWNTISDIFVIWQSLENNIVQKRDIEAFNIVWNPSGVTVTFANLKNINTTLSLSQIQVTSAFDLATLYETTYWERMIWDWGIEARFDIDTPSPTDFYISNVTSTIKDIWPLSANWGIIANDSLNVPRLSIKIYDEWY